MAGSQARPDDPALHSLMGKIEREHGLVLSSYKQPCLKRRMLVGPARARFDLEEPRKRLFRRR